MLQFCPFLSKKIDSVGSRSTWVSLLFSDSHNYAGQGPICTVKVILLLFVFEKVGSGFVALGQAHFCTDNYAHKSHYVKGITLTHLYFKINE